jgi:hypothetical protein
LTGYALTVAHTPSYYLSQPANSLFRQGAPKKSQALRMTILWGLAKNILARSIGEALRSG